MIPHPTRCRPAIFAALLTALLASCGKADDPPPEEAPDATWEYVALDLPGALFSVTGTSRKDVWIAGSDRGDGLGPALLHYDGRRWAAHPTGLDAVDLLWVSVVDEQVFSVGSQSTILRGVDGEFEVLEAPSSGRTAWGVWGARGNDVWAVGGDASGGRGFVWRYDGSTWSDVDWTQSSPDLPEPSAWYKVWGTARDDVWFCGTEGAMMHWDGDSFTAIDSATTRTLLTVHGRADGSLVTAVGGQFSGTLVASERGRPFEDVTPGEQPFGLLGVTHGENEAYAVGLDILRKRDEGPWEIEATELALVYSMHGVWMDPDGGVWAAGGQVETPPYGNGQLAYKGGTPPPPYDP